MACVAAIAAEVSRISERLRELGVRLADVHPDVLVEPARARARVGRQPGPAQATAPRLAERVLEQRPRQPAAAVLARDGELIDPALVPLDHQQQRARDLVAAHGERQQRRLEAGALERGCPPVLEARAVAVRPLRERAVDHVVGDPLVAGAERADRVAGRERGRRGLGHEVQREEPVLPARLVAVRGEQRPRGGVVLRERLRAVLRAELPRGRLRPAEQPRPEPAAARRRMDERERQPRPDLRAEPDERAVLADADAVAREVEARPPDHRDEVGARDLRGAVVVLLGRAPDAQHRIEIGRPERAGRDHRPVPSA